MYVPAEFGEPSPVLSGRFVLSCLLTVFEFSGCGIPCSRHVKSERVFVAGRTPDREKPVERRFGSNPRLGWEAFWCRKWSQSVNLARTKAEFQRARPQGDNARDGPGVFDEFTL